MKRAIAGSSASRKRVASKSGATQDKLLQAALALISEKGYRGAGTREIARRAGVCELTLFRHFGTKERLFERMLASHTFLPRLKNLLPAVSRMPLEEALTVIGVHFLNTLKERKALVRIVLSEIPNHRAEVRGAFTKVIAQIRSVLEGYLEIQKTPYRISETAVRNAPRVFLGSLYSFFLIEEVFRGRQLTRREAEAIVQGTVCILVHGLSESASIPAASKEV